MCPWSKLALLSGSWWSSPALNILIQPLCCSGESLKHVSAGRAETRVSLPILFLLIIYFSSQDEDEDLEDSEDDEDWDTGSTSSDSDSEEEEGKQTVLASRFLKK